MSTVTTIQGDCTVELDLLPAKSIQTCISSPPYFGLRDYKIEPTAWPAIDYAPMPGMPALHIDAWLGCLGNERTPEAFTAHLVHVYRKVRRVLRDDGTVWLNLGDTASNPSKWGGATGGKHVKALHGNTSIGRGKRKRVVPDKNIFGIPWRIAFALQADGWYLRSDIIWAKNNAMPESVTDRPTKAHEYMFLLAKQERYYYDADAVKEPATYAGARVVLGEKSFSKGQAAGAGIAPSGNGTATYYDVPATRNLRSVWNISTSPYNGAHYAVMPEKLVEPCIHAGTAPKACETCGAAWERVIEKTGHVNKREPAHAPSNCETKTDSTGWAPARHATDAWKPRCACPNNTGTGTQIVLDPFGGSGTVGRVAVKHGRDAILIEIKPEHIDMINERTDGVQMQLAV